MTSSNGCNSIIDRSSNFASITSQRPQPPAGLRMLPIEDLLALERLPPPVGARLLDRIYRTAPLGRGGEQLIGLPIPRLKHLVDGALRMPHHGLRCRPARAVDLAVAKLVRTSSDLPPDQRVSIRTLRPMVHPNSCKACKNAPMRVCASVSSAAKFMSTPTRRMRPPCCARAASGQAAAAPPSSVMNSRRVFRSNCTQFPTMSAAAPQDIESAAIRQRVAQPGDGPCAHKIELALNT